ncbi:MULTISPECIES: tetratricopeptide repeat protein [Spirulina sp. CCY15215]|uniref:tetratricopeptide repeat protein n=1 Tax=Spirulina sp. CCY15215 TaxID=2767591 RepID=UPI00194DF641|nr:tetratricopeptide repeat protein [Spirulina major]
MNIDDVPKQNPTIENMTSVPLSQGDFQSLEMGLNREVSDRQQRSRVLESADRGDYDTAIALLSDLLARHVDSAIDYNNRGLMYFQCDRYEEALADYNKALELDPRLDGAYNNRANCYVAKGYLGEAIADYQIALDFNPGNLRAWINQGITYRDLGLYDLALENFDITLVLGKRLKGRVYAERGRTYHLRGDWNSAIADYNRALEQLSNTFSARRYKKQVVLWLDELYACMIA